MQIASQIAQGIADALPILLAQVVAVKRHADYGLGQWCVPMMGPNHVVMATAAMGPTLLFVIAGASALPDGVCSLDELRAAQQQGPQQGFALRLFSGAAQSASDLVQLPLDGGLIGEGRRNADGQQLLCDAVLPVYGPERHWLGVYAADPASAGRYTCLDRFALSDANNETCWFYPTHDGTYLSWERDLDLMLQPGAVVDPSEELLSAPYERERISLLWSLLKDDDHLTSVGLTYGGQRVDWQVQILQAEPKARWSCFRVDSQMTPALVVAASEEVTAAS